MHDPGVKGAESHQVRSSKLPWQLVVEANLEAKPQGKLNRSKPVRPIEGTETYYPVDSTRLRGRLLLGSPETFPYSKSTVVGSLRKLWQGTRGP